MSTKDYSVYDGQDNLAFFSKWRGTDQYAQMFKDKLAHESALYRGWALPLVDQSEIMYHPQTKADDV